MSITRCKTLTDMHQCDNFLASKKVEEDGADDNFVLDFPVIEWTTPIHESNESENDNQEQQTPRGDGLSRTSMGSLHSMYETSGLRTNLGGSSSGSIIRSKSRKRELCYSQDENTNSMNSASSSSMRTFASNSTSDSSKSKQYRDEIQHTRTSSWGHFLDASTLEDDHDDYAVCFNERIFSVSEPVSETQTHPPVKRRKASCSFTRSVSVSTALANLSVN